MGWSFPIAHANLVYYLTLGEHSRKRLPRTTWHDLKGLLMGIREVGKNDHRLISTRTDWITELRATAEKELGEFPPGLGSGYVHPYFLRARLKPLRPLFSDFSQFGLIINIDIKQQLEMEELLNDLVFKSQKNALYLKPEFFSEGNSLNVLDPFPGMSVLLANAHRWPGMILWSRKKRPEFFTLEEVRDSLKESPMSSFYNPFESEFVDAEESLEPPGEIMSFTVIESAKENFELAPKKSSDYFPGIVHISDLHLGTGYAAKQEDVLLAHLKTVVKSGDRIVITGDVMDSPSEENTKKFAEFRKKISQLTENPPIIIPGNHDSKHIGNLATAGTVGEYSRNKWDTAIIVDEKLQCIFLGFESSLDATFFARGSVDIRQRRDFGIMLDELYAQKPATENYSHVALIHHHPFSFSEEGESWISRYFSREKALEFALKMHDAETFVDWCAHRGISLILHGHKHMQRYFKATISIPENNGERSHQIVAAACGTSMGAEGLPLTYNRLQWNPSLRLWTASFFESKGVDGRGFKQRYLAAHNVPRRVSG